MIWIVVRAFAAVVLLLLASGAAALPLDRTLGQFKHTRWTTDDGAPSDIRGLAQSTDGYLWIASHTGLYRFDGHSFDAVPTAGVETSVTTVMAARNGDLWVGLQNGHVIRQRRARQLDLTPSAHSKRIRSIVEDGGGGVWVATAAFDLPLTRYIDGRWVTYGPDRGVPFGAWIHSLLMAKDGAVWIRTGKDIRVLGPGKANFEVVGPADNSRVEMFADRAGGVWIADSQSGMKQIWPTGTKVAFASPGVPAPMNLSSGLRHLIVDRNGGLWGTFNAHGLFRSLPLNATATPASTVETFTRNEGLSSDLIWSVLEDREGNIWVGTTMGLDRFRTADVVLETKIPQQSRAGFILFSDHRGAVYIADSDTLYRALPGNAASAILHNIDNPEAICETSNGDVWLAAFQSLYRVPADQAEPVKAAPPPDRLNFLRCQRDGNNDLLFLSTDGQFYHFDTHGWRLEATPPAQSGLVPTAFTFDAQGRRVVFYENKGLVRFDGAGARLLWPVDKAPGGRIGPLYSGPSAILVGAVAGLARMRDTRVDLIGLNQDWLRHVTGIAETSTGDTWLQSSAGIAQVRSEALNSAFGHSGQTLHRRLFDARDGLPGVNLTDYADNGAVVGGDGRVWFTTANGVVWIDPTRLEHNLLSPPVTITRAIVNGRAEEDPSAIDLVAGTKALEIDYTALSLSIPERIRFKYRMIGFDEHWVDAGDRRQAFYAKLPPGSYRFKVVASNNDGVWNNAGAEILVKLPPTFLQSWVFKALCIAIAVLALWIIYRLRVGVITARVRAGLEGRLRERERIARELHDTLLQGVHGLILRFQAVAERIADQPLPAKLMGQALDRAEDLLVEGRDRVHGLRSELLPEDLVDLLRATVEKAELDARVRVHVGTTGAIRRVEPAVRDEISWIVRESLSNIIRHAEAASVEIQVSFGWSRLELMVRDDGRGFMVEEFAAPSDRGMHFGVIGMRERARRAGGSLEIRSAPPVRGTTVVATVPALAAYGSGALRRWLAILGLSSREPRT